MQVKRRGTVELCRVGDNESFGEESLLLNEPISYSVITSQPVQLAVVQRAALQGLTHTTCDPKLNPNSYCNSNLNTTRTGITNQCQCCSFTVPVTRLVCLPRHWVTGSTGDWVTIQHLLMKTNRKQAYQFSLMHKS